MTLTLEETMDGLHKMAENSVAKREAFGIDGENKDFIILVNALKFLEVMNR